MNTFTRSETTYLISNCGTMFGFLARLYLEEVDQEYLDNLCTIRFSQDIENPDIVKGNQLLKAYLKEANESTVTDLAVDYARVFLGVGPKPEYAAFPYESVYTSSKGLMMQEAKAEVAELYDNEGLMLESQVSEPEDHIAYEFIFVQYLCKEVTRAYATKNDQRATDYLDKIEAFFTDHLMRWVPDFCDGVCSGAGTEFYKGLGLLTKGYVVMAQQLFSEIREDFRFAACMASVDKKWEEKWNLKNA